MLRPAGMPSSWPWKAVIEAATLKVLARAVPAATRCNDVAMRAQEVGDEVSQPLGRRPVRERCDEQLPRLLRLLPARRVGELLHQQREELAAQQRVGAAVAQPLLGELVGVVGLLDPLPAEQVLELADDLLAEARLLLLVVTRRLHAAERLVEVRVGVP
eukprot:scaffold115787_cov57-Phaeocystis_antarctica.AAC.1